MRRQCDGVLIVQGIFDLDAVRRLTGFHRACGIEVPDGWAVPARFREPEDCIQATRKLLGGKTPPDCILYPDDTACIAGIAAAQGMGLSVPGDVTCFGFDGIRLAAVMTPNIATYRQNAQEIGRQAAVELISAIEDPKCYVPRVITVPGEIQPGGSVRNLAPSKASEKERLLNIANDAVCVSVL